MKYDQELTFVSNKVLKQLNEKPYLTKLLNKAKKDGFRIEWNKIQFQQFAPGVNTCGRWVCCFANGFIDGLTLKEIQDMLIKTHKETKMSYDQIVTELYQIL